MLTELKNAAESASPGPWYIVTHTCEIGEIGPCDDWTIYGSDKSQICYEGGQNERAKANTDYLVCANPANILSLIELVENMADALRIAKSMTPHGGVSYVCNEALKKYGAMK